MTEQKGVLKRALDAIDSLTAQLAESEARGREPIAVVGMSCRLPGGVNSPDEYWSLLREGRSGIREIPADRWDVDAMYDADPNAVGKSYTKHGGFMDSIDTFDAPFFGIAAREALTLDPQHRLLLECTWEALEDAGIAPDRLTNSATGVYIGITASDYARLLHQNGEDSDVYSASGTALNAAAGRISFALGLQGPAMAIDTACSSSLVAAHTATQALRARECDVAIVGGVNVIAAPDAFVLFSRWGMIAPGPECRTFDAGANGFVRGEGCGVLVLKRLSDALAADDRIVAVIRGSAVNQDGPSSGLSVPNGLAQAKVIRRALENAGLSPHDVGFIEAHGTGTVLGDPIEVEALGAVYGPGRSADTPLMLGSVKPSIGHLESAAGVAGLMKLILTVHHGELPPQRNYSEPNPRIDWGSTPVRVNDALRPWPSWMKRRIGAVSGFGFSGTNAHLIVEAPPQPAAARDGGRSAHVLPLSARTDAALRESAQRLAHALAMPDAPALADVARTLSTGRAQLAYRAIVVGSDRASVQSRLADLASGEPGAGTRTGNVTERAAPRIAFMYTGQGAQYPGMGLVLRDAFPVFREAFDRCDDLLRSHGGPALLDVLRGSDTSRINETAITQPALFALEYALTELFRSWSITPAAVLGHSVGEYTAACVAGVLPLEDALRLIAERGRLMQSLPAGGGMLAVAADAETARSAAAPYSDRVSLAALNGPRDVVLSGDLHALDAIAASLRASGIDTKPLIVSHAFHSPRMEPILDAFATVAGGFALQPPRIPLVSNLSGAIDSRAGSSAEYWRRHVREPVAFEASVRHLVDDGFRVFLEIGPRPVLLGMARRFLTTDDITWVSTLRGRAGETEDVLEAVGSLFTIGARPDWERVLEGAGRRVTLPTYPFQRRRHWIDVAASPSANAVSRVQESPDDHPLLGRRVPSPLRQVLFDCVLDPDRRPVLREHRVAGSIIVPAAAFIELGHAAASSVFGGAGVRLERGYLRSALILDPNAHRDVHLVVTPKDDGSATFEVFSRTADGHGEWTSHAGGRMVRDTAALTEPMADARARCTVTVDVDAYQQRMQDVGLDYGPSFRALTAALRGERQAFGELHLPADDALAGRLSVHPGLLDAAFHLIGLAMPDDDRDLFYLPVGYETADITTAAGTDAFAHVVLRDGDARTVTADIAVWRADGTAALRVRGLQVRPVTQEQFRSAIGADAGPGLLRTVWRAAPAAESDTGGTWLIVGGDAQLAGSVATHMRSAGALIERVEDDDALALASRLRGAGQGARGVIDLRTLSLPRLEPAGTGQPAEALAESSFADTLALLRGIAAAPPTAGLRIVLPTMNAHAVTADDAVEPLSTMVWGVAVTAAAELPSLDVMLVDLDDDAVAAAVIAGAALRTDAETRLAARGADLLVPRLVPVGETVSDELTIPAGPYTLIMRERGTLDGLSVQPAARMGPGPKQVEIEVLASGLNFRDVLNLLDMYPGPAGPLGNECCGRIVATGDDVDDLAIGDLVTCIAEAAFASHVVADAAMTFRVPAQLSAAQAAAFPIAQLTAYLALHHVGRMRAGDRVLIHAGAGGVGLAAVHLALAAGADVLASAGSTAKRDYLRALGVRHVFDSRSPATAEEMLAATDGHGFDLLLNSLTGDFIDQGVRALAPGGRFLEIGLREMRTVEQVRTVRDDVSYHPLLLGDVCREQPAVVRGMYDELCALLADERIPAPRTRSFAVADSSAAFRFMAKARHIGRVAITHPAASQPLARHDASYVVTGGLGALGLHAAEWLAGQDAGRIVLMGRSAPSDDAARRIETLRVAGARIDVVQGDVARPADLAFLADPSMPPVRGVIHAAGAVDDAVLSRVDTLRLVRALRPKADGACNLMRATDDSLDFFVMFSSGSALLGSPGQAAYAGANASMDGLARRMHADGRAALSINWGAWEGGGMAAGVDERTLREWTARGVGRLSAEQGIALLDTAIRRGIPQLAALPMDWPKFLAALSAGRAPTLLAELGTAAAATDRSAPEQAGPSIRETLLALPVRDRLGALTERLRREAAAVLGSSDPDELEVTAGLMEQGMDSLMAVELSGRLGRVFGVSLPTTFVFEYPTLAVLARHLLEQIEPKPAAMTVAEPTVTPGVDTELQAMSDAELEDELRRELDRPASRRMQHE